MTERIGKRLTEVISPIVPVSLSEAETESYPYASYSYTPEAKRTKDGIVGYRANATITVVSSDFDEAHDIKNSIVSAIESQMRGDGIYAAVGDWSPACDEGIWTINISVIINQSK